jgi:hypothetical protein
MKFLQKTPKILWALLLLGACATRQKEAPVSYPFLNEANAHKSLDILEEEEQKSPRDLEIKALLARAYWCQKRLGFAVQHWLWLERQDSNKERQKTWQFLVKKSGSGNVIAQSVNCQFRGSYPQ